MDKEKFTISFFWGGIWNPAEVVTPATAEEANAAVYELMFNSAYSLKLQHVIDRNGNQHWQVAEGSRGSLMPPEYIQKLGSLIDQHYMNILEK